MTNEKELRNSFIVDEDAYTKDKVKQYAEKALKYAKIAKNGQILIENHNLQSDDKIKLCLAVRFIAHNFDSSIQSNATLSEIQKIVLESTEAVGSRLSKIVKSGFAKKIERGVYQIMPHKIEGFLDELSPPSALDIKAKNLPDRKKRRTTKGVGKDIQELIDSGFLNTPKTIQEISKKLKEEVKFHDDRVIDATVRNGFVSNKKVLKRIPATDKGKARWEYVIRK
ncbi:MAG: hypothetical protein A2Y67_02170 [Candidatus Buchananbacteria bacterium RBG_13_39_9]|uniref:Uncharacterized protein n=1 Tax=Candidatus Buchananbacteria bacterium RBG_13_39_9 TaxID=1797531 RepID=A0A1G1XM84_9BACT|nr:MAG: hypothetical protein A2Y67_02170 [Candidatus Buchananbacteria bacterium RBG_13_39_9]